MQWLRRRRPDWHHRGAVIVGLPRPEIGALASAATEENQTLTSVGSWESIRVGRHQVDVFTPCTTPSTRGAVIALHGYDSVPFRERPAFAAAWEQQGLRVVCPIGPHCWWTNTIWPAFDPAQSPIAFLRGELVAWIQDHWGVQPPQIAVCGVEMGGQGALQLGYRYPKEFPVVVAIGPKVDFESWWGYGTTLDDLFPDREAARQQTATLRLQGLNWPRYQLLLCDPADPFCYPGVTTLASKLASSGMLFEQDLETSAGGFGWEYYDAMAARSAEFIARSLDQESRRIV